MPFQSKFKRNDKLNACAVNDLDHISEVHSPTGPHVRLIKEALNAWAAKQKPSLNPLDVNEVFDRATGDRVELYKRRQKSPILNFEGKIDRIVGKKTVAALDKELPPDNSGGDVPVVTKTFVDVVVRFIGGNATGANADSAVLDRANLTNYNTRLRSLVKIGRGSTVIRNEARGLITEVLGKIRIAMNLPGIERGIICVYGSSAGGRNAIELAAELNRERFPLVYVGVEDAAFFPNETQTVPDLPLLGGRPRNIPAFNNVPSITATTRLNFFQTFGNHAKPRTIGGSFRDPIWTSSMKFNEIHGDIAGFTRQNLDSQIKDFQQKDDDLAHAAVIGLATQTDQNNIAALLVKQTPIPPLR